VNIRDLEIEILSLKAEVAKIRNVPHDTSIEGVMKRLGKSRQTLWRWRRDGIGPKFIKVGESIIYPKECVDEWIAEQVRH
jgi:predicted DNA-binding transcriptional regulator AlpA